MTRESNRITSIIEDAVTDYVQQFNACIAVKPLRLAQALDDR